MWILGRLWVDTLTLGGLQGVGPQELQLCVIIAAGLQVIALSTPTINKEFELLSLQLLHT